MIRGSGGHDLEWPYEQTECSRPPLCLRISEIKS